MKKVLSLMLALVLVLSLVACGNSNNKDSIVGKWKMISSDFSKIKAFNETCNFPERIKESDDTAEFYQDGSCDFTLFESYTSKSYTDDNSTENEIFVNHFTSYKTKQNGHIYLSANGANYLDYEYMIKDNQLIIYFEDYNEYPQEITTITYDRI